MVNKAKNLELTLDSLIDGVTNEVDNETSCPLVANIIRITEFAHLHVIRLDLLFFNIEAIHAGRIFWYLLSLAQGRLAVGRNERSGFVSAKHRFMVEYIQAQFP